MPTQFFKKTLGGALLALALLVVGCSSDSVMEIPEPGGGMMNNAVVWDGATVTFEKAANADPSDAANQDRLTDNVWLTRGNDGGQIYNAKTESNFNKNSSPAGTQWALGTLDNVENLNFSSFRDAVGSPKDVVGKDLVLFLAEDNIFLSVKFTEWSANKAGSFAYERSSE